MLINYNNVEYNVYKLNIDNLENIIIQIAEKIDKNSAYKLVDIEYIPCGDVRFDYKIKQVYKMNNLNVADIENILELFTERVVNND